MRPVFNKSSTHFAQSFLIPSSSYKMSHSLSSEMPTALAISYIFIRQTSRHILCIFSIFSSAVFGCSSHVSPSIDVRPCLNSAAWCFLLKMKVQTPYTLSPPLNEFYDGTLFKFINFVTNTHHTYFTQLLVWSNSHLVFTFATSVQT